MKQMKLKINTIKCIQKKKKSIKKKQRFIKINMKKNRKKANQKRKQK